MTVIRHRLSTAESCLSSDFFIGAERDRPASVPHDEMTLALTAALCILAGCQDSPGGVKAPARNERIASILAPPSRVTLRAVQAPLDDILAEPYLQTGHRLVSRDVDRDMKVSFEVTRVEPWEAFDALCRSHGLSWGLRHSETTDEIIVAPKGDWSERTRFKAAGVTVELAAINLGCLWLDWTVYHGRAAPMRLVRIEVDELRDDKGTDLSQGSRLEVSSCHVIPPLPPEIVRGSIFSWVSSRAPAVGARFLSRVKGRLIVEMRVDKDSKDRHELTIPMDLKDVPIDCPP
ncbi:MAG TPA: hypothetical protein VFC86_12210 [Planctomycetota bacterium]|nr:hypothetical protein [Planctomycetota bacterium]